MDKTQPLRFGILGAAAIAPRALIWPARQQQKKQGALPEVEVRAVAARDPARARAFAARHSLPYVHDNYQALLDDPKIDAVYIALPNALHAAWTIRALEAGKHVLCEKPLASNAAEARRVASVAAASGRILTEALHYRYHPLALRAKEIIVSGEIGAVRFVEAQFCVPLFSGRDIRYRYDLGGGATMDLGCYAIDLIRFLSEAEPLVTAARARLAAPEVDRAMEAEFDLRSSSAGGVIGAARLFCSLRSSVLLRIRATVTGEQGTLRIVNPFLPHFFHRLQVRTRRGSRSESVTREPTYAFQLRAFVQAVRGESPNLTDAGGALATLQVIDAVYQKAGMKPRGM